MEMRVPPDVNMTVLGSLGNLDHFRFRHLSGEYPIMCFNSMIGSRLSLGDLLSSPISPQYYPLM